MSRYYKEDKDVTEDVELQAYLNEVSLNGTGPNGGLGRVSIATNHKTIFFNFFKGPVHTYRDIFESATFSFRIRLQFTHISGESR